MRSSAKGLSRLCREAAHRISRDELGAWSADIARSGHAAWRAPVTRVAFDLVAHRFGSDWVAMARTVCDPVFESADVGFLSQVIMQDETADALLWEADPLRFAERYPDSGIAESYGSGWPPPCVDFWVYIRPAKPCAVLHPEGWAHNEIVIPLSGDGLSDGFAIGREIARILGVPEPTTS